MRTRAIDPQRQAARSGAQPQLPRRDRRLLESSARRGSRAAGARYRQLRQGRTQPGDPRRSCVTALFVSRRAGVWRAKVMSNFMTQVRAHFDAVAKHFLSQLHGDEAATLNLTAEESLFVRFNGNRVRQNTDVQQIGLSVSLQSQGRSVEQSLNLTGKLDTDGAALNALLQLCREEVAVLAVDPNQVSVRNNGSSDEEFRGALLAPGDLVPAVVGPAQGCDLAGFYAGGVVIRANRNSAGQSHWFATETFFLDYSLYDGPRAAKGCYAGSRWDAQTWAANLARTRALLELLKRPKVNVKPGQYRTYLAPRAFSDL